MARNSRLWRGALSPTSIRHVVLRAGFDRQQSRLVKELGSDHLPNLNTTRNTIKKFSVPQRPRTTPPPALWQVAKIPLLGLAKTADTII